MLWRATFLRALSVFLMVISAAAGAVSVLSVPFLLRTLALPVAVFGWLYALGAAAGLAGSALAARLVERVSGRTLTVAGYALAAAAMPLLPVAGGTFPVAVTVAALGVALPVLGGCVANVGLAGVLTSEVPDHLLGPVTSAMRTAVTATTLAGALGGGLLGDAIGVRAALLAAGLAAVAGLAVLLPARRSPVSTVDMSTVDMSTVDGPRSGTPA
jgi:predicted MFS family arabinose efflux permease